MMSDNIDKNRTRPGSQGAESVSNVVAQGCDKGGCLDSQIAQSGGKTKAEAAKELFLSGCNCSQAVFCAFAGDYGLDADVARKVACGLGGGVGRMREVCGAVGGAALVFGLECGEDKMRTYAQVQEFCAAFKRETCSIICRELLEGAHVVAETGGAPEERTGAYYRKRPCAELVELAAAILDEMLKKGKTEK